MIQLWTPEITTLLTRFFKANHLPYGQDFPGHIPTGRFSNGKLNPDFVASFLGIKQTVPTSLDPNLSNDAFNGLVFASAGSGYDELTTILTGAIPVPKQLGQFKSYIAKLSRIFGNNEAQNIIEKSLAIISAGTNDFGFNYYLLPMRIQQFDINGFQDFLLKALHDFVKELYKRGCRKIVIAGLPPMGCVPILVRKDSSRPSIEHVWRTRMLMPVLQWKARFTETEEGCCGSGLLEASFLCNPETPVCETPSDFMFWDKLSSKRAAYKAMSHLLVNQILPKLTLE
ncbi:putative GDSL-like Lipase/Acylhydrolase family protein [Hibiscus syriacus]|uniref:GDSL-like Lipase/Acylhydrolase family protein n=1 Tax=Hibiscus syriacus TaxID=106335 RepID=A0A6A3B9B8_HIBSY|nr:putative GDSL-like Lipase/Acylhydrolase family protein [Hibiscus syriacus]